MPSTLKILLLEDDKVDAEIIERLLKKEVPGSMCKLAMNKDSFLQMLNEEIPDVIVSDNSLPQFNASEALSIIQERKLQVPFILVTGPVSEEFAASIIKQGADDYILKDRLTRLPSAISAAVSHKRAEREKQVAANRLKMNEEKYRTMMERVSDAFVALDINWRYTYLNSHAGQILNHKPEDLLGKNIWIEFPEGIDQPFYHAYHRAMNEQSYIHLEEYYSPLGVWLENHIYPSVNGLSIFFRDITSRKEAEERLIQSEENLKAIFDNSTEEFILLDENGFIKALNDRAKTSTLFNKAPSVEIGSYITEFLQDGKQQYFSEMIAIAMKGNEIEYDYSGSRTDKTPSWFNFSFSPVLKDGQCVGVCITGRDITEKKRVEQLREFDHNNLNALINNTRDLLWSVDNELRLITSNQAFDDAARRFNGTNIKQGDKILDFSNDTNQRDRYKAFYEHALQGHSFTEIESTFTPVESWSEISFYPIYEKGLVAGTACFSRDITFRKKAERQLLQLEQERLNSRLEEQKKIARAVLQTQERERNSIGMELHDNVNQLLVGTNLMLSMVQAASEKHAEIISNCMAQLKLAIEENRKIAHSFAAPDLDSESLLTQMGRLTQSMLGAADIQTHFDTSGFREEELDSDRKFNFYRIAQEQCTNIVKHANATEVTIKLLNNAERFLMTITDNGSGASGKGKKGVGLRNINDRLKLFDGTSEISTAPGQGFTLQIQIPL